MNTGGKIKEVHASIYTGLNYRALNNATICVAIPQSMLTSRKDADSTKDLRWASGICASDPNKRPAWEPNMRADLKDGAFVDHWWPTAEDNFFRINGEHGTWALQCGGRSTKDALHTLGSMIDHAFIKEGYAADNVGHVVEKTVQLPDRNF